MIALTCTIVVGLLCGMGSAPTTKPPVFIGGEITEADGASLSFGWLAPRKRSAPPIAAQSLAGACCLPGGCVMANSEAQCSAMGGFFFPNETCAAGWCNPGACCSETVCITSDAWNCIANGRDYIGPGILCSTDPCDIGFGACCLGGSCELLNASQCAALGGTFLGPGTVCNDQCALGACCLDDGCFDGPKYQCTAAGGTFVPDGSCADFACSEPSLCPKGTLFGNSPDGPKSFIAGTSEASANLQRYENFAGVGGAIEAVHWWGLDLHPLGGSSWSECTESDPTFMIRFLEDAGGVPGDEVCSWTVTATRTPTGVFYLGTELNEYFVQLPEPCVLTHGWISIVGLGDPECWFLWMSAGMGESWCDLCSPSQQGFDLAFCLLGQAGGVFGACCDDATGQCEEGVEITDCLGPMHRFVPNGTCAALDPPCGVITGACCFPNATCTIITQQECAAQKGSWLGPHTICSSCPCVVPCPAGATIEGEQTCFDGYVDTFNGGCLAETYATSTIHLGETVCGTGGVFVQAGSFVGDQDWYEITLDRPTNLSATVRAQFRPVLLIGNGTAGCPAGLVASGVALECTDLTVEALVGPGLFYVIVGPFGATDSAQCGATYTLSIAGPAVSCVGDLDGDNVVGASDLGILLGAWGSFGGSADLDGDLVVGATDLGILLGGWGNCP